MLKILSLRNFKSARELDVPLQKLTVLSGLNGSGKSTILQAIGLLRQSLQISNASTDAIEKKLTQLHLRGNLVQLGMASDILSQRASEYEIKIELSLDSPNSQWAFTACIDNENMDADTLSAKQYINRHAKGLFAIFTDPSPEASNTQKYLHNCHFQFLQADRLTPNTHYERSGTADRKFGFLGSGGQYTPDFLAEFGDKLVVSENRRCSPASVDSSISLMDRIAATPKLYDQVCGWLQHLSPGVRLNAERIKQTDLVTLGFSYASTELAQDSERRRPANVGFGLTYSLPIVTACLSAPTGSLLLLENPEAHLHPRGQAALGTLIAKCAGDGVQILVETHSDHILNGIRLAVKHGAIPNVDVGLHHFTRDTGTGDSYFETPTILPNGELTAWPEGFFDEWKKASKNY
jgi:predicted ATPase